MAKKILKPWGYEEYRLNKYYCLKKLFMKKIIDVLFNIIIRKLKLLLL